jgi:hypothetical protein
MADDARLSSHRLTPSTLHKRGCCETGAVRGSRRTSLGFTRKVLCGFFEDVSFLHNDLQLFLETRDFGILVFDTPPASRKGGSLMLGELP